MSTPGPGDPEPDEPRESPSSDPPPSSDAQPSGGPAPSGPAALPAAHQNGLGTLSTALGVFSFCGGPWLGAMGKATTYGLSLPLAIAAIVLGILQLQHVRHGTATRRSLAIIGIVLGGLGFILSVCMGATSLASSVHDGAG